MAFQKLTATKVDKYKPSSNDDVLSDGGGLYIRFRQGSTGKLSRTWMYTYKCGTKSTYLILGEHLAPLPAFDTLLYKLDGAPVMTLEVARKIAGEISDWRKRGHDPKAFIASEIDRHDRERETAAAIAAEKERTAAQLKHQADQNNLTVQDLFDAWLLDGVRRKDGNKELRRAFAADVLPAIGTRPIKHLTEHDLRGVLRVLVERGVNRAAVVIRNNLKQMFVWAEKRQPWRKLLVDGDPMDLIEIGKIVSPDYDMDNARDRLLSVNEIKELQDIFIRMEVEYDEAPDKRYCSRPLAKTTQQAIWIMLSTMCRVGELSMARWEDVNFDNAEWFIPKKNVKDNVADLMVYLSAFSTKQFRQLHALTGDTDWCFPARNNEGHVDVKSISKQVGDRQAQFKKGADGGPRMRMKNRQHDNTLVLSGGTTGSWTPHDLRRTGATLMQSLGVSLEIIDRCQNHVLPGSKVRRHYLHHDYADEKRAAWQALGNRLAAILNL
jgi:integrase